jgi:hypothetical protein
MAKKNKPQVPQAVEGGRALTLTLTPVAGMINKFFAFVDHKLVINGDGDKERSWSGSIPEAQVPIKIRVFGIGAARYTLGIDLPGTADDQKLEFTLQGGYHEISLTL